MSIDEQKHVGLGSEQEEQALQELLQFPFVDAAWRNSRILWMWQILFP
jgi:hypothetical protein